MYTYKIDDNFIARSLDSQISLWVKIQENLNVIYYDNYKMQDGNDSSRIPSRARWDTGSAGWDAAA